MNCEDVPSGEDWGDVTHEAQETLEQALSVEDFTKQYLKPALVKLMSDDVAGIEYSQSDGLK